MKQIDLSELKTAFRNCKMDAKRRDIEWELSFGQWLGIWIDSDKLFKRGRFGHEYQMARYGDTGPYSMTNVQIITARDNRLEMLQRRRDFSDKDILKIRGEYKPHSKNYGTTALAKKYGVCPQTIWNVVWGRPPYDIGQIGPRAW